LPRNNEIHEEVDFDPRAAYFRQVSHILTLDLDDSLT
jgi:aspartate carbamoyltransferase catalytic subunit